MVSPASAFHVTVIIEVGVIVLLLGLACGHSSFCLTPHGHNRGGHCCVNVGLACGHSSSALHLTVITEVGIAVLMWGTQAVVSPVSALHPTVIIEVGIAVLMWGLPVSVHFLFFTPQS